jgi:hypothetical protein
MSRIGSSPPFSPLSLRHLLVVISIGLTILYSFLYRKCIIHIHLLYLVHGFRRFWLWLFGPMCLGRTSWQWEHMAEESCLPYVRQEAEREARRRKEQETPKDSTPVTFVHFSYFLLSFLLPSHFPNLSRTSQNRRTFQFSTKHSTHKPMGSILYPNYNS